jgi:hypothetical protein
VAQVRAASSTQHLPAATVAAYALLWSSALTQTADGRKPPSLAAPKWRAARPEDDAARKLPSTGDLLRILRYETWSGSLRPGTLYRFATRIEPDAKCEKLEMDLAAQLFHAA